MSPAIQHIHGREILDSRGNPTVEVDVVLANGAFGRAAVPSGASTGRYEAVELRDGDARRFGGKGVSKAVSAVNGLLQKGLVGMDALDQRAVDQKLIDLDGHEDKSQCGANALLGISLAVSRAASASQHVPYHHYVATLFEGLSPSPTLLPMPMMNFINGGAHSDAPIDIQEFMIVPTGAPSFKEALRMGAEIFQALKKILAKRGLTVSVGDEGGFAPHLSSSREVLDVLLEAGSAAGFRPAKDFALALDAAANEFFDIETGIYTLSGENKKLTSAQLVDYYADLQKSYPIVSIEDGMAEDDFAGWAVLNAKLGDRIQIVGDDLFVTNPKRLQLGFEQNLANSILVKLNQIGSLTETLDTMAMAHRNGYRCVVSHRSGETEDTTIADLAVATGAGQIKTGSLSRTDRICKYNQLLRIEESLGADARFVNPFASHPPVRQEDARARSSR